MVFSSIPFLYYFLPLFFILYFVVPARSKNFVLFIASLVFYGFGEPKYVPVLLFSIVQGYIFALLIAKEKHAKLCLVVSLSISLGILAVCKYANFFVENVNAITGMSIPLLRLTLPIGISFYTFQMISYVVDVYKKRVPVQKNFINLGAYIAMFPQLVAGPIVRYADIREQLEMPRGYEKISSGIRRFVVGLSKKVMLANCLGEVCIALRMTTQNSVVGAWIYAIAYALQIYFDFSGYSDMAIGLGRILGFDFMENFQYPFVSKSATEFWRRWHISLGSWFRDYVYIPLGGNRVSKGRWILNIMVVWMLTGFWHGASWNFVLWGLFFGLLLLLEKLFLLQHLEKAKVWNHIYMFVVILFSFLLFDATSLGYFKLQISHMLGLGDIPFINKETGYLVRKYCILLLVALIGAMPWCSQLLNKVVEGVSKSPKKMQIWNWLETIVILTLLLLCTGFLIDGSFNPFLYFRF